MDINNNKLRYLGKGRILYQDYSGRIYKSILNTIFYKDNSSDKWIKIFKVPFSIIMSTVARNHLFCRLFRSEIRNLLEIKPGYFIASTKRGMFYGEARDGIMKNSRIKHFKKNIGYPINICIDDNKIVLWGEYFNNPERRGISIFASDNLGQCYEEIYRFKNGEIRHIHNIIYDNEYDIYWALCGDFANESGIGVLDKTFTKFIWVVRGSQLYRSVVAFNCRGKLIYATDTEIEDNYICLLDKKSCEVQKITKIEGSTLYGTVCENNFIISTAAEPRKSINKDINSWKRANIYISNDALCWRKVLTAKKDIFHAKVFQYGKLILPKGINKYSKVVFSGIALDGMDNKIYEICLD